jgi:hypothetical protein
LAPVAGLNGAPKAENTGADRFIDEALKRQTPDVEKTIARLERCLDADQQIDRNANQSTLIETWLDDLAGK